MTPESARQALFTAIEEGHLDRIPGLAAEYRRGVRRDLSTPALADALRPLTDAIQYLRLIRAHESVQFQKLAVEALYRLPSPVAKGRTLDVDA
jgi:hypothetical protein